MTRGPPQVPFSASPSQVLEQVVHCTEGLKFSLCLLFQGRAVSAGRKGCLLPITLRHTVYKSIALPPTPKGSRRAQSCGQRIQSGHGPVGNADEQQDKGEQRVEHGRHHLSYSPAGR